MIGKKAHLFYRIGAGIYELPLIKNKMEVLGIFIAFLIGMNLIPLLIKGEYPILKESVSKVLLVSCLILIAELILSTLCLKIKSAIVTQIIAIIGLVSSIMFLALQKNTKSKIFANFILIPIFLISIHHLLLYERIGIHELNNELNLVVSNEGFLGCGETIRITKNKFKIFDKQLKYESSLCLVGISKIEPITINDETIEIMIHHNGELDSENPYHYRIANENEW